LCFLDGRTEYAEARPKNGRPQIYAAAGNSVCREAARTKAARTKRMGTWAMPTAAAMSLL
jgi:hypothetical protein